MVVIWKHRGYIIALLTFAWLLALDWVTGQYYGDRAYYGDHGWPKLLAFWASAISVFMARRALGVPDAPEAATPAPPAAQPEGELFFVKARYWPAVLVALGVVFLAL